MRAMPATGRAARRISGSILYLRPSKGRAGSNGIAWSIPRSPRNWPGSVHALAIRAQAPGEKQGPRAISPKPFPCKQTFPCKQAFHPARSAKTLRRFIYVDAEGDRSSGNWGRMAPAHRRRLMGAFRCFVGHYFAWCAGLASEQAAWFVTAAFLARQQRRRRACRDPSCRKWLVKSMMVTLSGRGGS